MNFRVIGRALLESTDWASLHDAYSTAGETPVHLAALVDGDADARLAAARFLNSAVLHQGTPWSVTAPAVLVLAGFVLERAFEAGGEGLEITVRHLANVAGAIACAEPRAALEKRAAFDLAPYFAPPDDLDDEDGDEEGEYEYDPYESIFADEDAASAYLAKCYLALLDATPTIFSALEAAVCDPRMITRMEATHGMSLFLEANLCEDRRAAAIATMLGVADAAADGDELASHVMSLAQSGHDISSWLKAPDRRVSLCAALWPAEASKRDAFSILNDALVRGPCGIDAWFTVKPSHFNFKPRFAAIDRLVTFSESFEEIEEAALSILNTAEPFSADFDWGRLLAAAFPKGDGRVSTPAQRRFLAALLQHEALWDPRIGNARIWFRKAGLPHDAAACRALLEAR